MIQALKRVTNVLGKGMKRRRERATGRAKQVTTMTMLYIVISTSLYELQRTRASLRMSKAVNSPVLLVLSFRLLEHALRIPIRYPVVIAHQHSLVQPRSRCKRLIWRT